MPEIRNCQDNYSKIAPDVAYDSAGRTRKAKTILAVLQNYLRADTKSLSLVDVGCSTGIITAWLSEHFANVTGVDVDSDAIAYSRSKCPAENTQFILADSPQIELPDASFDVAVCAQVYEHVTDPYTLFGEIYRLLKPGGVCYFTADNRIRLMEPHYNLPLLSVIPRPIAHIYVKLAGKAKRYHEKHFSYWDLKKLVKDFTVVDYTQRIVEDPLHFHVEYIIRPATVKAGLAKLVLKHAYWLFPSYIWLLVKPQDRNGGV